MKKLLLQTGVFNHLSEHQFAQLLSSIEQVRVLKGDNIIEEGEVADACYLILEGQAEVITHDDEGRILKLENFNEGRLFGEQALLQKSPGMRSATVIALSDIKLAKISHFMLLKAIQSNRAIKKKLLEKGHHELLALLRKKAQSYYFSINDLIDKKVGEFIVKDKDEMIFRQGDNPSGVYFVLRGKVGFFVDENLIGIVGKDGLFGELAEIQKTKRTTSAKAMSNIKLLFIDSELFHQLYDDNTKLREMVKSLHRAYQAPRRGQVIQFLTQFQNMPALISCIHTKDGRNIVATKVVNKEIHSVSHVGVVETATIEFNKNKNIARKILMQDDYLIGIESYGQWEKITNAYVMVFEKTKLSEEQINHFKSEGELEIAEQKTSQIEHSDEQIICYCMNVTNNQIIDCINSGISAVEGVSDRTGAGTMCTRCIFRIEKLISSDSR